MSDYLTTRRGTKNVDRFLPPDVSWIDCDDGFERAVVFEPGYNDTVPHRYGKHGMGIRFLLRGPKGITQFLVNVGWVPGETRLDPRSACDFPMGYDVGYHARVPQYEGADRYDCEYSESGHCYYDGSGLAADQLLGEFITEGEPAVWRELREWHDNLRTSDPS